MTNEKQKQAADGLEKQLRDKEKDGRPADKKQKDAQRGKQREAQLRQKEGNGEVYGEAFVQLGLPLIDSVDTSGLQSASSPSDSSRSGSKERTAKGGGEGVPLTTTIDKLRDRKTRREATLPPLTPYITSRVLQKVRRSASWKEWRPSTKSIQSWATLAPLLSAVLAPLSTLYDIPGLTQRWYSITIDGVQVGAPDYTASLVLSAVGLALNITGNGLLILRFSSISWWHICANLSLVFWIAKTIVALINVAVFGANRRNQPEYSYEQGFWCAVISVILAGVITLALIFHAAVERFMPSTPENDEEDPEQIRMVGRQFMLSVTLMVVLLGVEALIFSKIESWTYLEGVYFAVVTGFTIGLGDFTPTVTSTKVLLFFFAVASIAYLANQVSMIVGFIQDRGAQRKARWRLKFEEAQQKEEDKREPNLDLATEIAFLEELSEREEFMSQLYDLFWSIIFLVGLLLVSAAAFSRIESWTYGNAVYFTYVVLLTVGYGDYAPVTPAGRSFFVIFAFVSVPIVTSFAVQTVTGLVGAMANYRLKKAEASLRSGQHEDAFTQHSDWISEHSTFIDRRIATAVKEYGGSDLASLHEDTEFQNELKRRMTISALALAIKLEEQSRALLIQHMKSGSREQTLLRADLHVQHKIRESLWKDHKVEDELPTATAHEWGKGDQELEEFRKRNPIWAAQVWAIDLPERQADVLEQIGEYRKTFAQFLAVGSKLLNLEGFERYHFERRLMEMQDGAATDLAEEVGQADAEMEEAGEDDEAGEEARSNAEDVDGT